MHTSVQCFPVSVDTGVFTRFCFFSRVQSKLVEMKGCATKHKQLTEISLVKLIVTSEKIKIEQGDLS